MRIASSNSTGERMISPIDAMIKSKTLLLRGMRVFYRSGNNLRLIGR